jgi:ribosomal protein S18 acetylase RimI-like enzyme
LVIIQGMATCEIRRIDSTELDLLEPLWNALRVHHSSVTPHLGEPRPRGESWQRRRRQYAAWLAESEAFVLLAQREGAPVGYAMVHVREGSPTWAVGERAGELETLSVLPTERGRGTGSALLEAVRGELATRGVTEVSLLAIAGNEQAIRFYERRGFSTHALWMRVGPEGGDKLG